MFNYTFIIDFLQYMFFDILKIKGIFKTLKTC